MAAGLQNAALLCVHQHPFPLIFAAAKPAGRQIALSAGQDPHQAMEPVFGIFLRRAAKPLLREQAQQIFRCNFVFQQIIDGAKLQHFPHIRII